MAAVAVVAGVTEAVVVLDFLAVEIDVAINVDGNVDGDVDVEVDGAEADVDVEIDAAAKVDVGARVQVVDCGAERVGFDWTSCRGSTALCCAVVVLEVARVLVLLLFLVSFRVSN